MIAARKFSALFWKNASEPPFFSPPPLLSEDNNVAAVSDAAAKSGIYFLWIGFTRLEYSISVKFTIRKPQLYKASQPVVGSDGQVHHYLDNQYQVDA